MKNASLSAVLSDKPAAWIALNFFYQTGILSMVTPLATHHSQRAHAHSIGRRRARDPALYRGHCGYVPLLFALTVPVNASCLSPLPLIGFALCMFLSVALKEHTGWPTPRWWVWFFPQSAAGVFWTIPARLFSRMAGGARGN